MLPKHPNVQRDERDEPATSPALARRRDHMLHGDRGEWREPRLLPSSEDDDRAAGADPFADDDFDPEIPPPPVAAPPSDEIDPDYPAHATGRLRLWPFVAGMLGLVVLGGAIWIFYGRMGPDVAGGEVPYITAEAGPEKIRPQEEGGLQVPNQDIQVYNELTGSPGAPETEVLLPPPEDPVNPPVVAEQQQTTGPAEIPSVPAPPEVEPAAGANAESGRPDAPAAPVEPAVEAAPAAPAEAAPPDEPVQTAAVTGAYRIQLAAVKSQDAAQVGWKKMAKAHPDVLGSLTFNVVKVDRSSGGALYRLQAGPFADRATAEAACGKLKQKRQDCLVVGP
jgi:cell division septation protein DedD